MHTFQRDLIFLQIAYLEGLSTLGFFLAINKGEFANNLPDYQKIEILMFVMGKVPGPSEDGVVKWVSPGFMGDPIWGHWNPSSSQTLPRKQSVKREK